jgi:hypothetical protein
MIFRIEPAALIQEKGKAVLWSIASLYQLSSEDDSCGRHCVIYLTLSLRENAATRRVVLGDERESVEFSW